MWDIRFWTFIATVVSIAAIVIAFRKLRLIDIQIMILVAAITMSCDMIFCKQYNMYHYISVEYRGWYSFWGNLIILPVWGLVFIKLLPKSFKSVTGYILLWTVISTMIELFIIKPLGIVVYSKWNILFHSPIGYFLVLLFVYVYYRILLNHNHSNVSG